MKDKCEQLYAICIDITGNEIPHVRGYILYMSTSLGGGTGPRDQSRDGAKAMWRWWCGRERGWTETVYCAWEMPLQCHSSCS